MLSRTATTTRKVRVQKVEEEKKVEVEQKVPSSSTIPAWLVPYDSLLSEATPFRPLSTSELAKLPKVRPVWCSDRRVVINREPESLEADAFTFDNEEDVKGDEEDETTSTTTTPTSTKPPPSAPIAIRQREGHRHRHRRRGREGLEKEKETEEEEEEEEEEETEEVRFYFSTGVTYTNSMLVISVR